jgi:hypothetical protein
MFSVQSQTSFPKTGFLTSSVKIYGNMSPSRRASKQDDLFDRSFCRVEVEAEWLQNGCLIRRKEARKDSDIYTRG